MGRIWKLMAMMVVLLSSCSEDRETPAQENEGRMVYISFRVGTPGGNEVEYGSNSGRSIQEEDEQVINRLQVYDFVVAEDTCLNGVYVLKKMEGASSNPPIGYFLADGNGTTIVSFAIVAPMESKHIFVFVANEMETAQPATLDDLLNTTAGCHLSDGDAADALIAHGAVMTGKTGEIVIDAAILDASVTLQRIIARIDVKNTTSADKNLRLKGISIENCPAQGFLFGRDDAGDMTSIPRITMKQNSNVVFEGSNEAEYKKVIYMYECLNTDAGVPTLRVSYTLNGSESVISVPMEIDGKPIAIKRNCLYTLQIVEAGAANAVVCRMIENKKED